MVKNSVEARQAFLTNLICRSFPRYFSIENRWFAMFMYFMHVIQGVFLLQDNLIRNSPNNA